MKKGFTLIEILVVIVIIGILSSVVLVGLNAGQRNARDARRITDLGQIQTALELYHSANGTYPGTAGLMSTVVTSLSERNVPVVGPNGATTDNYYYLPDTSGTGYLLIATLEGEISKSAQTGPNTTGAGTPLMSNGNPYSLSISLNNITVTGCGVDGGGSGRDTYCVQF